MNTKQKILEAATYTFGHYPNSTIDDVAKQAGCSRITVIRNFTNKEGLLQATCDYCVRRFDDVLSRAQSLGDDKSSDNLKGDTPPMRAIERIEFLMRGFAQHGNHYMFILRSPKTSDKNDAALRSQWRKVEALVIEAQSNGDLRADLPSAWLAGLIDQFAMGIHAAKHHGNVAERDLIDHAWDTFLNGSGAAKKTLSKGIKG